MIPEQYQQIEDQPQKPQIYTPKLRSIFFSSFYLLSIPVFVFCLILFSLALKYEVGDKIARQEHKPRFQALPSDSSVSTILVENHDARIEALDDFFAEYKSPLEGLANVIISEADKHEIDYRLLPAIAMQESTLCKKIIKDSHNCWGFGIYGGKVTRFDNYEDAIAVVTDTLAKKYIRKGLVTPEEIVQKYTPSDTGRWPEVVNLIMTRLENSL